jgi:hypothetical protein
LQTRQDRREFGQKADPQTCRDHGLNPVLTLAAIDDVDLNLTLGAKGAQMIAILAIDA